MSWVRGGVAVAVLLAVIAVVYVAIVKPGYGVAFYAVIPIVLAAFWFGRRGALVTAGAASGVYLLGELLYGWQSSDWTKLWVAIFNQTVIYFLVALIVTGLLKRERFLRGKVEQQEHELNELESVRQALIPTEVPARPGLDIATAFIPAEGPVAGDFFLVTAGPGNSTTIVVGDVMGHGFESASQASFVRATLATFTPFSANPAKLLQLANTALSEYRDEKAGFVTAICVNIAPASGRLSWASAGHHLPWMLDSGEAVDGGRRSVPLGLTGENLDIEAGSCTLRAGEGLLLFTDGLIEGRAAHRDPARPLALFGEERVREVLAAHRNDSPQGVIDALRKSVGDFAGGALADDVCVIACSLDGQRLDSPTGKPEQLTRREA